MRYLIAWFNVVEALIDFNQPVEPGIVVRNDLYASLSVVEGNVIEIIQLANVELLNIVTAALHLIVLDPIGHELIVQLNVPLILIIHWNLPNLDVHINLIILHLLDWTD